MVSFRQESEVNWKKWAVLRANHGIAENPLSYCSVALTVLTI